MAKRFTDTEKWNDEWFMGLDPILKCFWIYLCDKCDHAGVWKVNFRQASFSVGAMIDRQSALKAFDERVWELSLDKWFVKKFIYFQYPAGLNETNKAHSGVIKALTLNNIDPNPFKAPLKLLPSTLQGVQEKEKDKEQEMDKVSFKKEAEKNLSENESLIFRNSKVTPDAIIQMFNDKLSGKGKIKHCRGLSGQNIQDFIITTSYADFAKLDTWSEIFDCVAESEFLTGQQQGSSFVATLNWLVCHDNALKVLNGQYGSGSDENAIKSLFAGIPEGA